MTRLTGAFIAVVSLASSAAAQSVFISEVMMGNDWSYCDSFGDDPDWIEIHNPSTTGVDLSGWVLTDRLKEDRWTVPPNTTVPPKGYLVIFSRPMTARPEADLAKASDLHATFRLAVRGEQLALKNAKGVIVQVVRFGKQKRDGSIGCSGVDEPFVPLGWPTPNLPNDAPKPPSRCPRERK
jgi:hypothetical protein